MTATDLETQVERKSTAAALHDALDLAMAKDPKVLVLGEDVDDESGGGVFHVTQGLSSKYPDRVRSTPISEQAIVGAAIGASLAGYRPVAELMLIDFFAVAMDQIANHLAKLRYMSGGQTAVPVTIRTAAGGGMQFGAQHSEMLEAWVAHLPGLKVVMPSCAADAKGLLTAAIFDDDPVIVIEPSGLYYKKSAVPVGEHVVPIGVGDIKHPGSDVTLITYGPEVNVCLAAAEQLATEGIDAEVLDLRSLVPLDAELMLASVARTKRAVVVHQAVRRGGVGADIACLLHENLWGDLVAPVARVTAPNTPVPYAAELEKAFLVDAVSVSDAVRRICA